MTIKKMEASSREKDGTIYVWAEDMSEPPMERYKGPIAEVSHDKDWLHISTDSYEGHAMVNIEALPALIRALVKIKNDRKKKEGGAAS